jgi:hypothetical protein
MSVKVEYRVRPVERYIVTRWFEERDADIGLGSVGSRVFGEFENAWSANTVCSALAASEENAVATLASLDVVPD